MNIIVKIFEEDTPTSTYDLANLSVKQPLEFHPGEGWRLQFFVPMF